MPSCPEIALIHATTAVPEAAARSFASALQAHISDDFGPIWGRDAKISFWTHADADGGKVPTGAWWLALLDTSDQAGAAGYHDLTPNGLPMGKVFCKTALDAGMSWTVDASHEGDEMLGDPDVNLVVLADDGLGGLQLVAYETCDMCEADEFGYKKAGASGDEFLLTDFATPAWFEAFQTEGPFDFQKRITAPFMLLPGGYSSVLPVGVSAGWKQITNRGAFESIRHVPRASTGSRREKRRTTPRSWLHSTVGTGFSIPHVGKRHPIIRVMPHGGE